jgi:hypothetical protein
MLYSSTVAWYEFDTGSIIADSSGNGLNGAISGANWAESNTFNIYPNNAKSFNTAAYNAYVSIPNNSLFSCFGSGGKYTLECWYKNTGAPSSVGRIIGKGDAFNSGFDLRIGSDRKLIWAVVYGGGGQRIYLSSTTALTDNTWYHIAVTAEDVSNNTVARIYINGTLNATYTKTNSGGMTATAAALQMMGSPGNNWFANGTITRVKISDAPLTEFDTPLRIRALHLHLNNLYIQYYDDLLRADIDRAAASNYTHIILHINNYMHYNNDPLEAASGVYSQAQVKSIIQYAYSKKLKVIPAVRILTHTQEMLTKLRTNTNYQPASPTPGEMVTSSSGFTANPYYSYNGHTFAGITANIITEILTLFSDLYSAGTIDYQYPDYLLAGFDELQNSELQNFITQCGIPADTVRSKYVQTVNNSKDIVTSASGGKTKMIIWGDMLLSKQLSNAPYGDTDFLTYRGAMSGTADDMYLAVLNNEISTDVVIGDWCYSASNDIGYPGIKYFSNKGYKTIGAAWYNLDSLQSWADYVHDNIGTLTNVAGMCATSWSDNNRYTFSRADRFEAMLPTAGSLFFEIGSVAGVKANPAKPVLRCYAVSGGLYYLNTFFSYPGIVYFSAYVNDTETPPAQLTGTFYVKPHAQTSWTAAQNITATDKNITDINGAAITLTFHGQYVLPAGAATGSWDVKFVYHDNDTAGDISTPKTNYIVRENAFIVNTTGINDFTRKAGIAYYNFNLPSTTVANHLPGSSAPNGAITGSDYQADDTLYSYKVSSKNFNASAYNTYASVPHGSYFDCFGEKYTLECWYKNTGAPSGVGRIIGKGDAFNSGFDLRIGSDRKLIWAVVYGGGGQRIYLSSATALTDNTWYHLAVTAEEIINGSQIDLKASIYINGKLDAAYTKTNSGGMTATTAALQMMGSPGNNWFARGSIADVKIYNSVLTAEDINKGVLRLNFDEDAPSAYSVTEDHSRFFNIGNFSNITFSSPGADNTGKCAYFNGTSSTIKLPNYENLDISDSFYIRLKVKIPETPTSTQEIIQNGSSYGSGFEIRIQADRKLYIRLWTYLDTTVGSSADNAFVSANAISVGQWTDVVLSYDSVAKQIKLYVGGSLINTINTSTGKRIKAENIIIGNYCEGGLLFKGYVDEIIVENKVYTP